MSRYSETGKEPPIVEVTGGCVSPDMCCEQNSGPLQKHYVLWTAEPPLPSVNVLSLSLSCVTQLELNPRSPLMIPAS